MKAPIGIGVLSFAHAHVQLYADVMREFADVRLVAAYDDRAERAQPICERTGMRYTPHVEDVLGDPGVQAVMIGVETSRHAELVVAAAQAGKQILLQKPMALALEDCDRMNAACDRAGVTLAMAWQMRHDPANQKIRELVQGGELGNIAILRRRHCIGALLVDSFVNGPTRWHVEADKNKGMFADDAAHPADFLHWILGEPVSVMAEIDNVVTNVAPDDNGVAIFRFGKGEMGVILNSSTVMAAENSTEVYGDKGTLIQNFGDSPGMAAPRTPDTPMLKLFRNDTGKWEYFDIPTPSSHADRIQAVPRPWVDSLLNDTPPAATGRDGRIALEMILGAYRSSEEGRRVTFPLS
jgi:predicted dehydrogenase